ncbi:pathogenicity island protein [Staphylococcus aureus]|nr:pathogenicity island protein [Staphylococcus aureus]
MNYRSYKEFVIATETLVDFPISYEGSNVCQFITKEDIEGLKEAIEEMTSFIENLEEL